MIGNLGLKTYVDADEVVLWREVSQLLLEIDLLHELLDTGDGCVVAEWGLSALIFSGVPVVGGAEFLGKSQVAQGDKH